MIIFIIRGVFGRVDGPGKLLKTIKLKPYVGHLHSFRWIQED